MQPWRWTGSVCVVCAWQPTGLPSGCSQPAQQISDLPARPPPLRLRGLWHRCLGYLSPVFLVSDAELMQTAGLDVLVRCGRFKLATLCLRSRLCHLLRADQQMLIHNTAVLLTAVAALSRCAQQRRGNAAGGRPVLAGAWPATPPPACCPHPTHRCWCASLR